ncbi:MAG TPA: FadR/GntR family transcriptional regulator [Ktedonobacteraceae bacterium]|nr:FadR/GntR family transcriptional regulator [Ktedonobacteraceae bacterium]
MQDKKTQEPIFEPIVAPKRNFEIIEASIRREIYNGTLIPGQKLPNEFELAKQFNVGRSAVREALKVLELAGLLVVRRGYNGGTFVAPPDFEEASEAITLTFQPGHMALDQLLEACQTIEPRAAELAAIRASELEIDELAELVQRIEQCVHLPARYLTGIVDFHVSVTEMAHNSVFTLSLQAMRLNLIQELNRLIGNQQLRKNIILQLKDIYQAISDHDVPRAGQSMLTHLNHLNEQLSSET